MRLVSQLLVSLLLIAVAIGMSAYLGYVSTNIVGTYRPKQGVVSLVGGMDIEAVLANDCRVFVTVKLFNAGSRPIRVYGRPIIAVIDASGRNVIRTYSCDPIYATIQPYETRTLTFTCRVPSYDIAELFGEHPSSDLIEEHIRVLYLPRVGTP